MLNRCSRCELHFTDLSLNPVSFPIEESVKKEIERKSCREMRREKKEVLLKITESLDFVHSPGILGTRIRKVSEIGCVSVLR
jgi:hypothetical protein